MLHKLHLVTLFVSSAIDASVAMQAKDAYETYSFGIYKLDLSHGTEQSVPGRVSRIWNCSNQEFYCFNSPNTGLAVLHIVIPKSCLKPKLGTKWTYNGIETRVVAYTKDDKWLLHTVGRSQVIFGYDPVKGITNIHIDASGLFSRNLADYVVREGGLPEKTLTLSRTGRRLGACQSNRRRL